MSATLSSDLIAAIATPIGTGGVGIVRVSGSDLTPLLPILDTQTLPTARVATCCRFIDDNGEIIDSGLVLYFSTPHSFTGENVLELHAHGGVFVMQKLLARCLALGARQAERGEFTLRAYLNNKLDLLQAEAIADMICAKNETSIRAAARSLSGDFSSRVNVFSDALRGVRVDLESSLDFSDDDIGAPQAEITVKNIDGLMVSLETLMGQTKQGVILTNGVSVVMIGAPNVGKSSLLNYLAKDEVAIVSDIPGTTRDIVERNINVEGVTVQFVDGAGIRLAENIIEKTGIERIEQRLKNADMVISLFTADIPPVSIISESPVIFVQNKIDLPNTQFSQQASVSISAKTGEGIDALLKKILYISGYGEQETLFSARERHLNILAKTLDYLDQAKKNAQTPEIAAAWLSEAQSAMGEMIGHFDEEALLGSIFSNFCVGK